jgi:hypothetical protein
MVTNASAEMAIDVNQGTPRLTVAFACPHDAMLDEAAAKT